MKHVLLLFLSYFTDFSSQEDELKFPNVNELFNIKDKPLKPNNYRRANQNSKKDEAMFNLETLDFEEFRKTLNLLENEINRSTYENTEQSGRRNLNADYFQAFQTPFDDTRRQVPKLRKTYWRWRDAVEYTMAVKALDAMLTLIYMARHKIRQMEEHPLYHPKSGAFRIAFVFRKLQMARFRVQSVYSHMKHRIHNGIIYDTITNIVAGQNWWQFSFNYPRYWLVQHNIMANRHVNYVYVWTIVVKMHEVHCNESHIYMTKPTVSTTRTRSVKYNWENE